MSLTIAQIPLYKLKYIYIYIYIHTTEPKLLQNCNFLLKLIILLSLAINKMKILFCNIVDEYSMLKNLVFTARTLGQRLNFLHWGVVYWSVSSKFQDECHLNSKELFTQQYN